MNDSELDARLKAAREPRYPANYPADFEQAVLKNLRSSYGERSAGKRVGGWASGLSGWGWALATAACIVIAFGVGQWHGQSQKTAAKDVLADPRLVQETLALFPNRVRAIVQDQHGLKLVLADRAEVPASTPIYVRICDGENCSSLVTFSGQDIQIAGQKLTVLSQPDGGIILEGNQFVWSNTERTYAGKQLKIVAKNLDTVPM